MSKKIKGIIDIVGILIMITLLGYFTHWAIGLAMLCVAMVTCPVEEMFGD